ncbi:unnamed protein product [Rotaria sordida]|uniref:Uncharacterized protein n=1 Tax=Rotaria sordida TaxID=392033 RepID=A0A813Q7M6_9BILA|nr:unnamed protein product [Rotaria sordida]
MSSSNQFFMRNVPTPFNQLNSLKQQCSIDKNFSYDPKRTCELLNDNIKEHSYAKMIIESYDTLSKSQAIEFLQQVSSTESKLSLLDAMKDKVTFSIEEINELVPSTDSSSSNDTDLSFYDNLSYLSLLIPQQRCPHIFTSFNNAAQSTKTLSNTNKRSSLLRGLFRRYSSKQRAPIVKQSIKNFQRENKKRSISGGDQVKLSHTKCIHMEQSYQSKHPYNINIQDNIIANQENTNNKIQLSLQGLHYDFKQIKAISTINSPEIKQLSKDPLLTIPFDSRSSFVKDKSLSSLSDPISIRQQVNEQKQNIQSVHSVGGIPKITTTNSTLEKTSFNANQHKYYAQTPNYNYPKRLSAIKILAKQYSLPVATPNNMGLFWYSANQQTMNRTVPFSKHDKISKKNNRFDSSSDSRDTSSSSSLSSTSNSTETTTNSTSSNSSSSTTTATTTTSNSQKPNKSTSTSTSSSYQSKQQTIKLTGQYNRNQNDRDDFIRIELNSITSRTSTSTNTSLQPCHRRSIPQKQLSIISNSITTSNNHSSSSTSSTSSLTTTNKNKK